MTMSFALALRVASWIVWLGLVYVQSDAAAGCRSDAGDVPAAARVWTRSPAVVEVDSNDDLYVIGDPHGDPERLEAVLLAAKLIASAPDRPEAVRWAGQGATLVITGDLIDKWPNALEVIALVRALQADAAIKGGRVIVTMGNHEAEFLAEPCSKKTREFASELMAAGADPVAVAGCGGDIGAFLCALPLAARINDWFISHAGNTHHQTIAQFGAAIEEGFSKDGFASEVFVGENSVLEARLNKKGPGGLPWFQDGDATTDPMRLLAKYAQKLGVRHLVQGHQYGKVAFPDGKDRKEEYFFQRSGLLFLVDTGMSRGIEESDSIGGALHVSGHADNQTAEVICADRTTYGLWGKKSRDREQVHCGP